ncbi:hypothetical protein BDZ89DRAFT_1068460 [Hymenopellis radicata]|nr:hypothetical protein BDZ89DRAFT_1068460 [Hymenopellis radicata]
MHISYKSKFLRPTSSKTLLTTLSVSSLCSNTALTNLLPATGAGASLLPSFSLLSQNSEDVRPRLLINALLGGGGGNLLYGPTSSPGSRGDKTPSRIRYETRALFSRRCNPGAKRA